MNTENYLQRMKEDGRVATLDRDGKIVAIVLFSICDDSKSYLDNFDREYMEHNPLGHILVVDFLITAKFKFAYVDAIQDYFCERFPNLEKAMWRRRRFPKDKIYTLWRRHAHAIKN